MTKLKKCKVHTAECKVKVGLEAVSGGKTIKEISAEFGAHPMQVSQWTKEIPTHCKTLFEGKRGSAPAPIAPHAEPERMYGEISRLTTCSTQSSRFQLSGSVSGSDCTHQPLSR